MSKVYKLIAALSLALSFLSCQKSGGGEEAVDSVFVVEDGKIINAGVDGGRYSVKYSIDGPKEGRKADVTSDEPWIKIGSVYNSSFTVTLDRNDSGADRTGRIRLACPGVKETAISVVQSKDNSGSHVFSKFNITVSDITTSTARVQIVPVDAAVTYLYSVIDKATYDSYGSEKYIKRRIEQIKEAAILTGGNLDIFLSKGTFDTASRPENAPSFLDDTDYYVAVFDLAFDAQGNASYSGFVELREFRSKKATPVNMTFTLAMDGTVLTVKPSNYNQTYIMDVTTKELWDSYASPEDMAREYISVMKSYGRLNEFLYSGLKSYDFLETMTKSGQYVAYAVGYRDSASDGGLTTAVEYKEFSF